MNNATHPANGSGHVAHRPNQDSKALPTDYRMRQAVARIAASRSALIVGMMPDPPGPGDAATGRAGEHDAAGSFSETLKARIERNGLLQGSWRTARTLARRWWTRQPWHSSVDLVVQTLAHQARPLIGRHPLATLAVGAALGGGLVAVASVARSWASQRTQRYASPWRDRMGSLLWTQLTAAPVQMALAGALAAWLADQGSRCARTADATPGRAQAHAPPSGDAAPGTV